MGKFQTLPSNILLIVLFLFQLNLNAQDFIPKPIINHQLAGYFKLENHLYLNNHCKGKDFGTVVTNFIENFEHKTGYQIQKKHFGSATIEIQFDQTIVNKEGYRIQIDTNQIKLSVSHVSGLFYAFQTIYQLLPAVRNNAEIKIPCMQIQDQPAFTWRGMHLDVSRHYFSIETIKQYLDLMAMYKMNKFHWHLVDDQGWRIEIKKFPKLTQIGAWRVNKNDYWWNDRPQASANEEANYGGFYTQNQIREVIAYAASKQIEVIPEIEMPGHVASAIAAYAGLSCKQNNQFQMTGGNYTDISSNYCAGNEQVFIFLENVLNEVFELFPSQYVHIGGDEVDKTSWKNCKKCQLRMKTENLKDEEELQSYFIKRIGAFVEKNKKKMIGWDEILEGGLAKGAIVMSWRGEVGGIEAAKMKHNVIMTPGSPCYFDHYQGNATYEPKAFNGFNSLKSVYNYRPIPLNLADSLHHYVLGAQGNVWSEYIQSSNHLAYMILPRMLALSEVLWGNDTTRKWDEFYNRIQSHFERFDLMGLNYAPINTKIKFETFYLDSALYLNMSSDYPDGQIYFTKDNSLPGLQSELYEKPIQIDSSAQFQALLFKNKHPMSPMASSQEFVLHKAIGGKVTYNIPISKQYKAEGESSLINGIRGPLETKRNWQGIIKENLDITLELPQITSVSKLALGCLNYYKAWVFLPDSVHFSISTDGNHFESVGNVISKYHSGSDGLFTADFELKLAKVKLAKFIKVEAINRKVCPTGHPGEGQGSWIFADELIVE
jgi:hexosaminidase